MALPVFVINLDRRPERWAAISEDLDRIGVTAERISAIDGQRAKTPRPPARGTMLLPQITPHEIACTESHCKAMTAFLATPHPAALILEDDAALAPDIPSLLVSTAWWPEGVDLIRLTARGGCELIGPRCGETPGGRPLHRLAGVHWGADGYLIGRQAAQAVLDTPLRERAPIDYILFDLRGSRIARRLKPAQTVPGPVGVRAFESDLEQPRLAMREEWHKQRWRRMGEKIYSRSRSRWLRVTRQARQRVVEYVD